MRELEQRLRIGWVVAVVAASLAAGCAAPASQHVTAVATVEPGIPRYYVTLDSKGPVSEFSEPLATATVRVTATGAVLARILAPRAYMGFTAVTGAADDRTFVLLAHARTDPFTGVIPERFFVLRIDPTAPSALARTQLTALPTRYIPGGQTAVNLMLGEQVRTMALSPSGGSLAAILTVGSGDYLYIYNLATGKSRRWVWKPCSQCDQIPLTSDLLDPSIPALSWTSDGRSLAFTVMSIWPVTTQLRLLHLGARGSNLVASSTPFVIHAPASAWQQAVMTPDGTTVLLNLIVLSGIMPSWISLLRSSTSNGRLATINTLPIVGSAGYVSYGPLIADTILWTNGNGSKVIIADARPGHTLGVYSGGRYTPLPWSAHSVNAAW